MLLIRALYRFVSLAVVWSMRLGIDSHPPRDCPAKSVVPAPPNHHHPDRRTVIACPPPNTRSPRNTRRFRNPETERSLC